MERSRTWPILNTIPGFAWRDRGKPLDARVGIAGLQNEI
jgi:hypothetical protein